VRRDVRFEEDRAFRKSRETTKSEQSSTQIQGSPQQTSVIQSSGPPILVTTNPQGTRPQMSGSQVIDPQISRSYAPDSTSGSQSLGDGIEQKESTPQDTTLERRKPEWLQDTLKEARGSVGNPKHVVRESKPPKRFCSYLA
jgi:hypothetical protein